MNAHYRFVGIIIAELVERAKLLISIQIIQICTDYFRIKSQGEMLYLH